MAIAGWLWIRSHGVTIADEATITLRVQSPFICIRLAIPEVIAPAFDLLDLKIGNVSQFKDANPIPCSNFASRIIDDARCARLRVDYGPHDLFPTGLTKLVGSPGGVFITRACMTAQDIVLSVKLRAGFVPVEFEAFMFGKMTDPNVRYSDPDPEVAS